MSGIEAPEIETFKPIDSYRNLGIGFVVLQNPEGVRLDLSEAGAAQIDQDPDLAPLLTRMGRWFPVLPWRMKVYMI